MCIYIYRYRVHIILRIIVGDCLCGLSGSATTDELGRGGYASPQQAKIRCLRASGLRKHHRKAWITKVRRYTSTIELSPSGLSLQLKGRSELVGPCCGVFPVIYAPGTDLGALRQRNFTTTVH